MFIGHFGVGLAAKKISPKTSLGTLVLSVQLVDLLWPIFLVLGLEQVRIDPGNTVVTPLDFYNYPITHSLVGATCWALRGPQPLGAGFDRPPPGLAYPTEDRPLCRSGPLELAGGHGHR